MKKEKYTKPTITVSDLETGAFMDAWHISIHPEEDDGEVKKPTITNCEDVDEGGDAGDDGRAKNFAYNAWTLWDDPSVDE